MPDSGTGKAAGRTALLVIDMINDLAFGEGEALLGPALAAAHHLRALCDRARAAGVPVIYVNDNFGQWHSERSRLIEHCLRADAGARELVEAILPQPGDLFVIKPQFSGFYATSLPVLLPQVGANRLILTGIATDICVQFTAADAHMRDYELWVPADCTASTRAEHGAWALEIMRKSMGARTEPTGKLSLDDWIARAS